MLMLIQNFNFNMNFLFSRLISLALLLNPVFGLCQKDKNTILQAYANPSNMTRVYNDIQRNILSGMNPCKDWKTEYKVNQLNKLNHSNIFSEVKSTVEGFLVTVDDTTSIITPAFLVCKVSYLNKFIYDYLCLVTQTSAEDGTAWIVIKINRKNQKSKFMLQDELINRELVNTYSENFDGMRKLYKLHKDNNDKNIKLCKLHGKNKPYETLNGTIEIRNITLHLDEKRSVNLPGVLKCTIKYNDSNEDSKNNNDNKKGIVYYIAQNFSCKLEWHQIYLSSDEESFVMNDFLK